MRKILLLMFAMIILLNSVSAIQHFQQRELSNTFLGDADNKTTRIRSILVYSTTDGTQSNIKNGNPLELYFQYNTYITTWNNDNPTYAVDSCNLVISKVTAIANETVILYNKTFTDDNKDGKFFVSIVPKEDLIGIMQCHFTGIRPDTIDLPLPADLVTVTPTWECKACQEFEWSQDQVTLSKAKVLSDSSIETWGFIKGFITLNFELIIILFWIILIIILFLAISLIFFFGFWVLIWLKRYTK